jgi:hypothetical protein
VFGPEFSDYLNKLADSAFIADGSAVSVHFPRTLAL